MAHGWAKGAPFRLITFWVDWADGCNAAAIHAEWSVCERTADELDDTTVTTTACEIVRLPTSTLTVVVQVRALIQRMVSHEVDECLLVENKRLFDPHKPKHPNLRKL